jgi:hypothetical protein
MAKQSKKERKMSRLSSKQGLNTYDKVNINELEESGEDEDQMDEESLPHSKKLRGQALAKK